MNDPLLTITNVCDVTSDPLLAVTNIWYVITDPRLADTNIMDAMIDLLVAVPADQCCTRGTISEMQRTLHDIKGAILLQLLYRK